MLIDKSSNPSARVGSVTLELAIVTPVFLLVFIILLAGISEYRSIIAMRGAVEQATEEASVIVPVISSGIDGIASLLQMVAPDESTDATAGDMSEAWKGAALFSALLEECGIDGQDIIGTALFGTVLRDRIYSIYQSDTKEMPVRLATIRDVSVVLDYDPNQNLLRMSVSYQSESLIGKQERSIISFIPVYGDLLFELPDADASRDAIWLLDNLERGNRFRSQFGGNLPTGYPVISCWNPNTATSIRSIDLTAPGYQSEGTVLGEVYDEIDSLSQFDGTLMPWGESGIYIREGEIKKRVLLLIVPENSGEQAMRQIRATETYALSRGVSLRIETYGSSHRYSTQTEHSDES